MCKEELDNSAIDIDTLKSPLKLPCGAILPNRLAKSAMTEGLSDEYNRATDGHVNLYRAWNGENGGGCGLLITGNIIIDRRYMERPGNIAIVKSNMNDKDALIRLKKFAKSSTTGGTHCWVQLSHAGRQQNVTICKQGAAPSPIAYKCPDPTIKVFPPRELSKTEIEEIIESFVDAAVVVKKCGFTGVQLHAAHGYLVSSFLNPLANQRNDKYGGNSQKRANLLIEALTAVRKAVGPEFPVSIKLNSSDFQKGGFTLEEAVNVAQRIDKLELVDLLELSGGNYENPAMMGGGKFFENLTKSRSTVVREAYFLEMAEEVQKILVRTKLLVTGGFRSLNVMGEAIRRGSTDCIGIGRPMCGAPKCVHELLSGKINILPSFENSLKLPILLSWATFFKHGRLLRFGCIQAWYYCQIIRIADGNNVDLKYSIFSALLDHRRHDNKQATKLLGLSPKDCVGTILNKGK